jgi:glycosyltransferase involved in cell wall biosynthesis
MKPLTLKFGRFLLLPVNNEKEAISIWPADTSNVKEIKQFFLFLKKISSKYLLLIADEGKINCDELSFRRLLKVAGNKRAGLVYSDFILREGNNSRKHPLIDYQTGSIRDDFNFGHLLVFSCGALQSAIQKYGPLPSEENAALYDLRLKISAEHDLIHVPEFLYTVSVDKQKKIKISDRKAEAHFAYVAKENFARQKKLEKIATNHLKRLGAYLSPRTKITNREPHDLQWNVSVVIPVLNRKETIADALNSALEQKTNFAFNVIVVDNHSTDGTTDILKKFASKYPHVHHIIPSRRDLGIGDCWNEAIYSSHCGRYSIQLDSDDLYSSKKTLQKIVDTLRRNNYAMVIGSYTIVNKSLKKIPPGLIAHKEWTQANGHNNALRINGLGAPRAFNTSVIREIGFPNVSYGEDYAVALRIAREYKIGRIYESLYLCRRWTDNTDAGLSVEKQNRNDFYKDELRSIEIKSRQILNKKEKRDRTFAKYPEGKQKSLTVLCLNLLGQQNKSWPALTSTYRELAAVRTRSITCGCYDVSLQFNPQRAVSSGAAVDAESIKFRPCFLCKDNLPGEQQGIIYRNQYLILCNPAPIFENHFTIVALRHKPQEIAKSISWLLRLSADVSPEYTVFYNGPACGASAPDHLHFQMIPVNALAFLSEFKKLPLVKEISSVRYSLGKDFDRSFIVLESKNAKTLTKHFLRLLKTAQKILATNDEPLVNVICTYTGDCWRLVIFLRRKHRPDAYFAEGKNRIIISPGAIDMAGVIITPRLNDYDRLDCKTIRDIYQEVSLPEDIMNIIMNELLRRLVND